MANKIDDSSWNERLAAAIGARVKHYRETHPQRLSAQTLADRTADLGHEVKRSVIANLESGRRGTVSVADAFVLAQALEVPPMLLLTPLGLDPVMEVLPKHEESSWDAVEWISGRWAIDETPWGGIDDTLSMADRYYEVADVLEIYNDFAAIVRQVVRLAGALENLSKTPIEAAESNATVFLARVMEGERIEALGSLLYLRRKIALEGLPVPRLPAPYLLGFTDQEDAELEGNISGSALDFERARDAIEKHRPSEPSSPEQIRQGVLNA